MSRKCCPLGIRNYQIEPEANGSLAFSAIHDRYPVLHAVAGGGVRSDGVLSVSQRNRSLVLATSVEFSVPNDFLTR